MMFPVSDNPVDWQTFATYFNGTTGTWFSILAGVLLFFTLKSQNRQNTETTFFNYLNTFAEEKKEVSKKLISIEKKMLETVHKREKVEPGSTKEKEKKKEYVKFLKNEFIATYSSKTDTPRLKDEFSKYFRGIQNFTNLITKSNLNKKDKERLEAIFLSHFSDQEIKMICYYYYLIFDIIQPKDKNYRSTNYVKESRLLEGNLGFSDDFLHNFDPRKGHFNEFIKK